MVYAEILTIYLNKWTYFRWIRWNHFI